MNPPPGVAIGLLCSWCDLPGKPLPEDVRDPFEDARTRACPQHVEWVRAGAPWKDAPRTPGSIAQTELDGRAGA